MSEHTPAPWSIVYMTVTHTLNSPFCKDHCGKGELFTVRPDGAHVTTISLIEDITSADGTHVVCFGHDYGDYGGILNISDARLIEAAPELLAELKTLRQAIEGHRAGTLTNDGLLH